MDQLECPFTWKMSNLLKHWENFYIKEEDFVSSVDRPLLSLMHGTMSIYIKVSKMEMSEEQLLDLFEKCDDMLVVFKKKNDQQISFDVASYVLQATKCWAYEKLNMDEERKKIFDKIKDVKFTNELDVSTLIAIKGICWSKNHRVSNFEAEKYLREAIEINPNCHLWYYALAKYLRRKRRDLSFGEKPNNEEMDMFVEAYLLSDKSDYKINLALAYKENGDEENALKLYDEIFNDFSNAEKHPKLLLRLALGFMRIYHRNNLAKAKKCLNKVGEMNLKNSMYFHYMGIYYMKIKNYNIAIMYLEEATKLYDINAAKDYMKCKLTIDQNFDVASFLLNLLNKYEDYSKEQLQPIMLDLAMYYWKKNNDLIETLNYFHQVLKINSNARCLTFYQPFNIGLQLEEKNVFVMLKNAFLPRIKNKHDKLKKLSDDDFQKYEDLVSHCDAHFLREV